jgi:rhodanese-related sulfurtransferase
MGLPKTTNVKSFPGKIESLLIPGLVVLIVGGLLIAGFLIVKKDESPKEQVRDTSGFTGARQVSVHEGKTLTVGPKVEQITPEELKNLLSTSGAPSVVQVSEKIDYSQPHIKGTIYLTLSDFDQAPVLDQEKNYVFVSEDGYDSAEAISKLVDFGYLSSRIRNLEGGLKAWKEKGFPLEK